MISMTPVDSSNIKAIGYDHGAQELHVQFHGGNTHIFANVPAILHQSLMAVPSKGSYFHAHVKGKFDSRKA